MYLSEFVKAYVLHVRPFSDSRLIVEWFTEKNGRITTVARSPGKKTRALYQLFHLREIQYKGAVELKSLLNVEVTPKGPFMLIGSSLKCGFYVNELITRVLAKEDPADEIFHLYERCLTGLSNSADLLNNQVALRNFELDCITQLGFAVDLAKDAVESSDIIEDAYYHLRLNCGFVQMPASEQNGIHRFLGERLLKIASRQFDTVDVLLDAKILCRMLLAPLVGHKPLKSRELFQ